MASLTIKGIPEGWMDRLRESAQTHRRSLNSEVIYRLERSVEVGSVDADRFLARIRARQARSSIPPLTDEFLDRAIEEGRP
jgi:plasmid stability protein